MVNKNHIAILVIITVSLMGKSIGSNEKRDDCNCTCTEQFKNSGSTTMCQFLDNLKTDVVAIKDPISEWNKYSHFVKRLSEDFQEGSNSVLQEIIDNRTGRNRRRWSTTTTDENLVDVTENGKKVTAGNKQIEFSLLQLKGDIQNVSRIQNENEIKLRGVENITLNLRKELTEEQSRTLALEIELTRERNRTLIIEQELAKEREARRKLVVTIEATGENLTAVNKNIDFSILQLKENIQNISRIQKENIKFLHRMKSRAPNLRKEMFQEPRSALPLEIQLAAERDRILTLETELIEEREARRILEADIEEDRENLTEVMQNMNFAMLQLEENMKSLASIQNTNQLTFVKVKNRIQDLGNGLKLEQSRTLALQKELKKERDARKNLEETSGYYFTVVHQMAKKLGIPVQIPLPSSVGKYKKDSSY